MSEASFMKDPVTGRMPRGAGFWRGEEQRAKYMREAYKRVGTGTDPDEVWREIVLALASKQNPSSLEEAYIRCGMLGAHLEYVPGELQAYRLALDNTYANWMKHKAKHAHDVEMTYLYGDTGVGKTLYARVLAKRYAAEHGGRDWPYTPMLVSSPDTGRAGLAWDDYRGEGFVLIDNYRPDEYGYRDILGLFDAATDGGYLHTEQLTHGRIALFDRIIVCSNEPYTLHAGSADWRMTQIHMTLDDDGDTIHLERTSSHGKEPPSTESISALIKELGTTAGLVQPIGPSSTTTNNTANKTQS